MCRKVVWGSLIDGEIRTVNVTNCKRRFSILYLDLTIEGTCGIPGHPMSVLLTPSTVGTWFSMPLQVCLIETVAFFIIGFPRPASRRKLLICLLDEIGV